MKTLLEQIREIDQRIRQTRERAYQLWEEAGKPECDGEEFWYKAKNALNAENAELVQNTEITMTTIWAKTAIMKTFREHLDDMGKYPCHHPDDDKTDTEEQIETPKILDTDAKTATEEQIEKAKERLNDKRDVENFLMDFKHGYS